MLTPHSPLFRFYLSYSLSCCPARSEFHRPLLITDRRPRLGFLLSQPSRLAVRIDTLGEFAFFFGQVFQLVSKVRISFQHSRESRRFGL